MGFMHTRKNCSMRDTICKSKENFKILKIILSRVILLGLYLNKPIKLYWGTQKKSGINGNGTIPMFLNGKI